ncbi:MAG: glycosyltransferase family 39 protein [Anaerolineales bacterium]|nr:glycosyltransferase family 39 protein [Anaerolineales bacterium]
MTTTSTTAQPPLPGRPAPSPLVRLADQVLAFRLAHPLWVLLAVALLVRLLAVNVRFVIGTDEGLFLTLGRNLAAGLGYTGDGRTLQVDFPPGFSLFAAAVYALGGGPELPSKLNQLLFGTLLVIPIYWLGKHLATEQTGFRAGLFVALVPALVLGQSNFEAVAEPLYTLLFFTAWALLWRGLTRQAVWAFALAGLALGAAHLVRWEALVLGLLAAGLIVLGLKRASVTPLLVFLAGLLLFAVPYGLFLYQHTGSPLSPKTRITQWHSAALDAQPNDPFAYEKAYAAYEAFLNDPHTPLALPALSPLELLSRYFRNLLLELRLTFTTLSLLTPLWLIPLVAGVAGLPRRRAAFLLVPFLPPALIPFSVVDPRYFLPALPAALLLAACGWHVLDTWLPVVRVMLFGRSRRWPLVSLLVALTLAVFAAADLAGPFLISQPTEYRTAGLVLRGLVPAEAHLLARKRQIPFYAGATWEWLPYGDLDTVLAYAASHGAHYLVLDAATTPTLRPQLAYLLDPAAAPASLTPIYVSASGPAVVVYQITP